MVKCLLDSFIDAVGFFTTAAGLTLFLAQLFLMLFIALRRFEDRLASARTWRGIAAASLTD